MEKAINHAYQQQSIALAKQAEENSNALNNEKQTNNAEVQLMQKALERQKTGVNGVPLPPGAEESIRKSLVQQYEKALQAEVKKDKISNEQLSETMPKATKKAAEDFGDKENRIHQQSSTDAQAERALYRESLFESEEGATAKIRNEQMNRDDEINHLMRQFSNALERQKKDFEHMYKASKDDAAGKLATFQQESDINSKMTQRAFARQQNEISREYKRSSRTKKRILIKSWTT